MTTRMATFENFDALLTLFSQIMFLSQLRNFVTFDKFLPDFCTIQWFIQALFVHRSAAEKLSL